MYEVSDKYNTEIKKSERSSCVVGTITALGQSRTIDDSMFIKDTFYITNRCVNGNKLELGSVYSAECGFSLLKSSLLNFNNLVMANYEAKLTFEYRILYDDETYDSVPLGTFYVDSAVVENGIIKITAIDCMYKLDKKIKESITDNWYNCVKRIANVCGLSLAQSQDTLVNIHANTSYTYSIRMEKISSYRDAISNLSTVICAFAYIDRNGKLMFKQFSSTVDDTNDKDSRIKGCQVEDYSVTFNAVKARFLANNNYVEYESTYPNKDDGITLDLGDIAIVGGTSAVKDEILMHIRDTAVSIEYTPMTLYIPSNPAYDLGDMLYCKNPNNTTITKKTYIMEYKFEYRKKETIKSFGENPRLQMIKDKSGNDSSRLENQIEEKDVITLSAKNTHSVIIDDTEKKVLRLKYAATIDCYPIILVSVKFTLSADGNVYFELHDGGSVILETKRIGYFSKGTHTQTLAFTKFDKKDQITNLDLYMWCEIYSGSDMRTVKSEIAALNDNAAENLFPNDHCSWTFTTDDTKHTNQSSEDVGTAYNCLKSDLIAIKPKESYVANIESAVQTGELVHSDGTTEPYYGGYDIRCELYGKRKNLLYRTEGEKYYDYSDYFTTYGYKDRNSKEIENAYYTRIYITKSLGSVQGAELENAKSIDGLIGVLKLRNSGSESYVDDTKPTLKINETDANIIVYSQGIDGDLPWDGTIEFSESLDAIGIKSIGVNDFAYEIETELIKPTRIEHDENIDAVGIVSVGINDFDAYVNGEYVVEFAVVDANCNDLSYNTKYVDMSSGAIALKQDYTFTSIVDTIDSGKLAVLSMDLSQFNTVESVVIE